MRPCSAISCRCWSRCVGAVSAVSLGTAPERGGTMIRASGWRSATERETPSWSYAPSPVNEASGPATWSSKGPTCEPSSTSWVVSSDATIRPVAASTPRCSFRQDRRLLVPCFSISHSPGPHSFRPVLSTSRCTGSASLSDRGRGTSKVSALRLRVVWSGTERARPSRRKQADDGADQAFGLAQSQAEYGLGGQRRRDRQRRVVRLPAWRGARLRPPGRNRLVREPDRQTPALAQRGPVRHPAPRL